MALQLEEFDAYKKCLEFWRSVTALLERPAFRKERKLREQIADATDSITANLAEGFEQPTDRAFANYVFHSKGSIGEVLNRLREGAEKGCITQEELEYHQDLGDQARRLLAGLTRYLYRTNFKDRGRYKSTTTPKDQLPTLDNGHRTRDPGPRTRD